MRIQYLINGECAKKNFKNGKNARPMSVKGLRHFFIFVKVKIPLEKSVLSKYIRNKPDFSPPTGPFLHTRVLEEILR